MKLVVARKPHRCDMCGRLIPVRVKYWRDYEEDGDNRQHTNCLFFEKQPLLPSGFNSDRVAYKHLVPKDPMGNGF